MSLIILHVIHSLIGYTIIGLIFNCATWSLSPEHHFPRWAKLMLIFLVISFRLEQQAWFWVDVVPMVPKTFHFIIPLTWCRRWLITSSGNLSTNVSWSSSTFWALQGYRSNSCWEIWSLPLDDLCYHRQHPCLPSTQMCSCFGLNLEFLAIQQLFFFTLEYYHLLCQESRENCSTS